MPIKKVQQLRLNRSQKKSPSDSKYKTRIDLSRKIAGVMSCPRFHKGFDVIPLIRHTLENAGLPEYWFAVMPEEKEEWEQQCVELSSQYDKFHCFDVLTHTSEIWFARQANIQPEHASSKPIREYGFSKIAAIMDAPQQVKEILWLDCDVYIMRPLLYLFEEPKYLEHGAIFWSDMKTMFRENNLIVNEGVDYIYKSRPEWRVEFETSIFLLDRQSVEKPLAYMCDYMLTNFEYWKKYSLGDKELWHYAFMFTRHLFAMPWLAGSLSQNEVKMEKQMSMDKFISQVKFDFQNDPILIHQVFTQNIPREEDFSLLLCTHLIVRPEDQICNKWVEEVAEAFHKFRKLLKNAEES